METKDYLKILKEEIHSTVIATVDREGLPVARVIDIMLVDDNSLYFITAKGKEFYHQLTEKPYVAISGMCGGEGTMNKKAISIRGKVRNIGSSRLSEVFEKNPYMAEIYPEEESRMALEAFQVYEGNGEFFDLSVKPIHRAGFVLGKEGHKSVHIGGFFITHKCQECCLFVFYIFMLRIDVESVRINKVCKQGRARIKGFLLSRLLSNSNWWIRNR